jgi:hypothetical protein
MHTLEQLRSGALVLGQAVAGDGTFEQLEGLRLAVG